MKMLTLPPRVKQKRQLDSITQLDHFGEYCILFMRSARFSATYFHLEAAASGLRCEGPTMAAPGDCQTQFHLRCTLLVGVEWPGQCAVFQ
eukprot:4454898-Pleurochrysis_carterae.AAC.6